MTHIWHPENGQPSWWYFGLVPLSLSLCLGYLGAFETGERLQGYAILAYWVPSIWLAWLTLYIAGRLVERLCVGGLQQWVRWLAPGLGAFLGTALIALEYYWYESLWFPQLLPEVLSAAVPWAFSTIVATYYPLVLPLVLLLALPINLYTWHNRRYPALTTKAPEPCQAFEVSKQASAKTPATSEPPLATRSEMALASLLARLPAALGSEIVCLEAQQHYLKVYTHLGSELIYYRLGDAVQALQAVDGMQVHRSYWVQRAAVRQVERAQGRVWLHLVTGQRIPVSRSFLGRVKQAGWFDTPRG